MKTYQEALRHARINQPLQRDGNFEEIVKYQQTVIDIMAFLYKKPTIDVTNDYAMIIVARSLK